MKTKTIARIGAFFIIVTVVTSLFFKIAPFKIVPYKEALAAPILTNNINIVSSVTPPPVSTPVQNSKIQVGLPNRIIIPAIKLNSSILSVGKGQDGNMAVPSGKTNNVGWYKDGTIPGNMGSAVFDAHVFAAFSNLKNLKPGNDIYVVDSQNRKLHFVVQDTKTYPIASITSKMLFDMNDARRLNLITCAGKLTSDKSTYDHRLIVYAVFAGIENA